MQEDFRLQPGESISGVLSRHHNSAFFQVSDGVHVLEVWVPKPNSMLVTDALTDDSITIQDQQRVKITAIGFLEATEDDGVLYHLEPEPQSC